MDKRVNKRLQVSAEEFITVWQTSDSLDEVTGKLGIKKGYASTRASKFRKMGVPLKYFYAAGAGYDWDKLASLAAELMEEDDAQRESS